MRPWTKIRCVYSLLSLMLLVACGDKTVAITDVQPLLFQAGDLPQNLAIRPIQRSDAQAFYNAQILEQDVVAEDGTLTGSITIYIFQADLDRDAIYDRLTQVESQEGTTSSALPQLGEQAIADHTDNRFDVIFQRCQAIVHIWLKTTPSYTIQQQDVLQYATALDQRLHPVVCNTSRTTT